MTTIDDYANAPKHHRQKKIKRTGWDELNSHSFSGD
jgi:hypothetical protein